MIQRQRGCLCYHILRPTVTSSENSLPVLFKLLKPFMKYRGNNIWSNGRTNGCTNQTMGQPKNIMSLPTLSSDKDTKIIITRQWTKIYQPEAWHVSLSTVCAASQPLSEIPCCSHWTGCWGPAVVGNKSVTISSYCSLHFQAAHICAIVVNPVRKSLFLFFFISVPCAILSCPSRQLLSIV